ncbi:MAG: HAMP domain-containing protein, partial [Chloroflexi bacterium]|nr:HAMP domain-containing protein [Chloroflexota bacterium]
GPPPPTRDMNLSGRPIAEFEYLANGTQVASLVSGVAEAPDAPPVLPPIPSTELNRLTGRMFTAPAQDGSEHYRVFITRGPRGEYQITAGVLRQVEATVFLVQRVLAVAGAAALAVAAFASWQVISRGLRPVAGMIDAAAAIGAGDLTRRAPNDDPSSELGRLGAALNQMMDRIEEAVQERAAGEQRLRQFAADAAHELRTPLTSLRGYAELFRQGALPDEESMAHAMRRIEAESARTGTGGRDRAGARRRIRFRCGRSGASAASGARQRRRGAGRPGAAAADRG